MRNCLITILVLILLAIGGFCVAVYSIVACTTKPVELKECKSGEVLITIRAKRYPIEEAICYDVAMGRVKIKVKKP